MEKLRTIKNRAKVDLSEKIDILINRLAKFKNEEQECILDNYIPIQLVFKIMVDLYLNCDESSVLSLLACYDPDLTHDLDQELLFIDNVCRSYFANKHFGMEDIEDLTLNNNTLYITYLTYAEFEDDPY